MNSRFLHRFIHRHHPIQRETYSGWFAGQNSGYAANAMANRRGFGHGARNRNDARRFLRALRVSYF